MRFWCVIAEAPFIELPQTITGYCVVQIPRDHLIFSSMGSLCGCPWRSFCWPITYLRWVSIPIRNFVSWKCKCRLLSKDQHSFIQSNALNVWTCHVCRKACWRLSMFLPSSHQSRSNSTLMMTGTECAQWLAALHTSCLKNIDADEALSGHGHDQAVRLPCRVSGVATRGGKFVTGCYDGIMRCWQGACSSQQQIVIIYPHLISSQHCVSPFCIV